MRVVCRNVIIYSRVREVDDLKDKIAGELVTESDKHYPDFRYEQLKIHIKQKNSASDAGENSLSDFQY